MITASMTSPSTIFTPLRLAGPISCLVYIRETLRFCNFVGAYFPQGLKVVDRLRATFSRAISAGVASTLNDSIRRLQLAATNLVATSMIPPVTNPLRLQNSRLQLAKFYAPLSRGPTSSFHSHISAIVSRDSFSILRAALAARAEALPASNNFAKSDAIQATSSPKGLK